jgi:hypothetical protein
MVSPGELAEIIAPTDRVVKVDFSRLGNAEKPNRARICGLGKIRKNPCHMNDTRFVVETTV